MSYTKKYLLDTNYWRGGMIIHKNVSAMMVLGNVRLNVPIIGNFKGKAGLGLGGQGGTGSL